MSPFFNETRMAPTVASSARPAAALEMSACLAMASINSDLFTKRPLGSLDLNLGEGIAGRANAVRTNDLYNARDFAVSRPNVRPSRRLRIRVAREDFRAVD